MLYSFVDVADGIEDLLAQADEATDLGRLMDLVNAYAPNLSSSNCNKLRRRIMSARRTVVA